MHIEAHMEVDLVAVEMADTVSLLLEFNAPEVASETMAGEARPEHTAVIALDRSASMAGDRLEAAKRAILELVAQLDDRDNFGLVAFDGTVTSIVPARAVGRLGRERIAREVRKVGPGGSTDLAGGYLRARIDAARVAGPAGATIVVLSDGRANGGAIDNERLQRLVGKAAASGVTTSTIGIGDGYDEELLSLMAVAGSGNHWFATDADAASVALAGEVEGLMAKTALAASILIKPVNEVRDIGVLNDLATHPVDGGLLVELGDFHSGEVRRVMLDLEVPAMAGLGLAQVAELTLTYVELPDLLQHTVTVPVSVNVVPSDEAAGRMPSIEVRRERLLLEAQRAKRATQMLLTAPEALQDQQVAHEVRWLGTTRDRLTREERTWTLKRLRSDATSKSRGYTVPKWGGEVSSERGEGDDESDADDLRDRELGSGDAEPPEVA